MRRPADGSDAKYDHFFPYEIADPGKWTTRKLSNELEFTQTIPANNGYGYNYNKTVSLVPETSDMLIWHALKNTGSKTLESNVYDHNFLVIDHQSTGPGLHVRVPFNIKTDNGMSGLTEASAHEIRYTKTLSNNERAMTGITGFGDTPNDYDITVENQATGAAVRITADHPLERFSYWSVKSVVAPEPFIHVQAEPGAEFRWAIRYHFYVLR